MIMVILSIVLIPIIPHGTKSGEISPDRVAGFENKVPIVANNQTEAVVGGDYQNINCPGGGFDPNTTSASQKTGFPTNGRSITYTRCEDTSLSPSVWYQWTIASVPEQDQVTPTNNDYYQAALNVYSDGTTTTPMLTVPTFFMHNSGVVQDSPNNTGVAFSMDVSGSMASSKFDDNNYYARFTSTPYVIPELSNSQFDWQSNQGPKGMYTAKPGILDPIDPTYMTPNGIDVHGNRRVTSPYMFYRYDQSLFTSAGNHPWPGVTFDPSATPPLGSILHSTINKELDISYGSVANGNYSDPDLDTGNNEKFPYGIGENGLLGTGWCAKSATDTAYWKTDPHLQYAFIPQIRNVAANDYRKMLNKLCGPKDSTMNEMQNIYMSRIEAARTSALALMLSLEKNPSVASTLSMGYIPWQNSVLTQYKVPMEKAQHSSSGNDYRFVNMREQLLWINRLDPSNIWSQKPILSQGGTGMQAGIAAAKSLLDESNQAYKTRIIVLLTDGEPTVNAPNVTNQQQKAQVVNYVKNTLGNGQPDESQKVTLFTVGLIGADGTFMNDMAEATPNGQGYTATDISQLKEIFKSISYQIQRLALLNSSGRYNIRFSQN